MKATMRGFIKQRGDSYRIAVSLGKDPTTGRYKYQWETIRGNKKAAERRLAEILHQLDTGNLTKPAKTTVEEYLQRWLNDYAKINLSPRGFERYQGIVQKYLIPNFGKLKLTQLRAEHLQKHYSEILGRGISPRTLRHHHAVIHVALQTAVKWGLVARNVTDSVELPHFKRTELEIWNESEVNQFLEAAKDSQHYALFYTALFTGMRRSELLALRWQDVDFIYSQIYVSRGLHQLKDGSFVFTQPKSNRSRRTIALPPSAFLTLKEHHDREAMNRAILRAPLTDDDLVFGTVDGKPLCPNNITYAWARMATRAGVKVIRLHDARHTHASLMLKQGIHPKIVQERLGHASIQMTLDTYSHVAPGLQEAAANSFDELVAGRQEKEELLR